MTPSERRSSLGLALIFALRMLGLFLVVPVFELEASHYAGANPASIGMAMGVYGLTQAVLQLPLGMASDRWGRKRLIALGLLVFAVGSVIAAMATTIDGLLWGRAIQGAGAVSAAVTALLADQTRDVVRTKAMAMIGASIGLVFSLALIVSPLLAGWMGLSGMFWLVAVLALLAVVAIFVMVPPEPALHRDAVGGSLAEVLAHPALLRLNVGVFVLHAVQLAMWMVLPRMLVEAGLVKEHHWYVYLPAVLGSFLVMGGVLFRMERKGKLKQVFLASIVLVGLTQLALWWMSGSSAGEPSLWTLGLLLLVFFSGFNMLEASQPSLVSRQAPPQARGMALGVYNTLQSLGLFAGGAVGGILIKHSGPQMLFMASGVLMLLWLLVALGMTAPGRQAAAH
ncbi:MFS transporter [Brachymonas denitrificans]|uniref:Predicted arabinose efflux permease, MFS family n=1 Tax=Brachymonas denitrificans DSM 15123 TaxID=1121117 RepID=A0A1H8CT92_9BURK|nr:MFS transporter [Brachymonas denitrificans]SEM97367.1 Predicted arabinose efflux permease, MFS family [Brachymonas denitrificans DSM 15123]